MAVPVAAIAASLAYVSGRFRLPLDLESAIVTTGTLRYCNKREKQDRYNPFYVAEENAQNKQVADRIFLLYEGRSYTFKQFYDTTLRYAGWLRSAHHVAQGEIVALDFMNCPELLLLSVAIWSLGATPAMINYNLSGDPLAHSLRISSARLFITEPEVAASVLTPETKAKISSPTFRNNSLPMDVVVLDRSLQTSVENYKPYRAPDTARSGAGPATPSALMSTSGTTGLPKQAIVAMVRFFAGGYATPRSLGLRPVTARNPDIFYTAMPLYHASAFVGGFGHCMIGTTTLAIGRKFSVSGFWPDVKRYNATSFQYVGEVLRYLIAAPAQPGGDKNHKVRLAFGNGLRPDVWKRFKSRFGIETIVEFYGATEGTFVTFNISRNDFSDGAVGQYGKLYTYLLSKTLAIVKLDWEQEVPWRDPATGFCVKVPSGEPGEMLAKVDTANLRASFPGYHNNEEATEDKVMRDVFVKGDAYFRTGDVLRWDTDGRMWFSDRIGDTFRWRSENVSTMEVGETLGYHPEVLEANVYGVSVPGHEGRAGCAALRLKDSALEGGTGSTKVKPDVLRSLATYSRRSLQKVSVPVFLRVVRAMEMTGNNKSVKHALRSQGIDLQKIQDLQSGDTMYWLEPGAESYVLFEPQQLASLQAGNVRL